MSRRVNPSLVISLLALFVALGGTSYAISQLPKNSVGTKQLKNRAVNSNKVRDGSLLLKDFRINQVKPNVWEGRKDPAPAPVLSTFSPIASTNALPRGNYVLLARANVIGGGLVTNRMICSVGDDAAQNFAVGQSEIFPLSMNGTLTLTTPQVVSLSCTKTAGDPAIAQAHVIAIPIAKLDQRDMGA